MRHIHGISSVLLMQASLDIDAVREIELEERLGSGAFGTVFRGVASCTSQMHEITLTSALW